MLRLAAVLTILAVTTASARDTSVPPVAGDNMRVREAPVDMPETADVVEVASGVVWPVLDNGTPSPKATKVHHGVYFTALAYSNLEKSVEREVGALRAEVERLNAELARRTPPGVPVSEPAVSPPKVSTPVVVAVVVVTALAAGVTGCRLAGGCK